MKNSLKALKNIDIEKLYHFYLIYRAQSIKAVSEKENISVTVLRHSLNTIESKLGINLYLPSKKTFVPTIDAGKLYKLCRFIIETLDNVEFNDSNIILNQKRELIIISTTTFANYYLPVILKKFYDHYPDVFVKVYCGSQYVNSSEVSFDIKISTKINNTNLSQHYLGKFHYQLYASKEIQQRLKNITHTSELINENLLLFSAEHLLDQEIIENNHVRVVSNSYPFLIKMCNLGLGILSNFQLDPNNSAHDNIDIYKILPDYVAEIDDGYFYFNRVNNKIDMIEKLLSISKEYISSKSK